MKTTGLYQWHLKNGANMASFGGYEMPLWYPAGAKHEHLSVIHAAGLFDTSHMSVLTVEGVDAHGLLQEVFSKDLERCLGPKKMPLADNRCVYGLFLTDEGHVIDDAIVNRINSEFFMVVVNAGMGGKIATHLASYDAGGTTKVIDYSGQLGKIDVQGPATIELLKTLLADPEDVLDGLIYFSFKGWFNPEPFQTVKTVSGIDILVSRTGYTGEFGVEIFVQTDRGVELWEEILDIGTPLGLLPCGLAARDSLRAGAVLPLSHQDIGERPFANTPWEFALADKDGQGFSKDFPGSKALLAHEGGPYTYAFAGYDPRKIIMSDETHVATSTGEKIGEVLTCTTDMAIGRVDGVIANTIQTKVKGLSCGFVLVDIPLDVDQDVFLVAGKRKIKVEIRNDIRPGRTARFSLKQIGEYYKEVSG